MAWSSPRTWVALEVMTAALLNTHLRDNLLEAAPAKVTTAGDLVYASGANALSRLGIGSAAQQLIGGASAPAWSERGLPAEIVEMIERGTYKLASFLGPPSNAVVTLIGAGGYPSGTTIGAGWLAYVNSGTLLPDTTAGTDDGSWAITTGATSGHELGFFGPRVAAARDWTLVARVKIPSTANQEVFVGAKGINFGDANDLIAFRVSGTGNVEGVCDSGGVETTRGTGATGATEMTLRIEVRSGGTIVRFYKNNAQIGADVTTNIPTGALTLGIGIRATSASARNMRVWDAASWIEVG